MGAVVQYCKSLEVTGSVELGALCNEAPGKSISQKTTLEQARSYNYMKTNRQVKNGVFWDVTPCGSCKNLRFGGT
jgi:hypothetical protein